MYRWVDHTAEVELEIEAASEREVLEAALRALAELLGVEESAGLERRSLVVSAPDRPALLAAWIEELAFLAESEGFVATHIDELDLETGGLSATVAGMLDEPPPLVKAVTYHRLAFEPSGEGYVARVILDV
ncbi:MAG TPA: archease [Solirubrobacteraceae bacterium]|nr:archease [Solirubrobacteraceae bacterium]